MTGRIPEEVVCKVTGKIAFRTRKQAQRALSNMRKRAKLRSPRQDEGRLEHYLCPFCNAYHLGHGRFK